MGGVFMSHTMTKHRYFSWGILLLSWQSSAGWCSNTWHQLLNHLGMVGGAPPCMDKPKCHWPSKPNRHQWSTDSVTDMIVAGNCSNVKQLFWFMELARQQQHASRDMPGQQPEGVFPLWSPLSHRMVPLREPISLSVGYISLAAHQLLRQTYPCWRDISDVQPFSSHMFFVQQPVFTFIDYYWLLLAITSHHSPWFVSIIHHSI